MAFETYGSGEKQERKSTVDFDALNAYVIETADLKERTVLAGIVSGIVDLGLQEQEDAAVEWKGTEEEEAAEIAARPGTYFETGPNPDANKKGMVRLKRWKQKPIQSVAIAVDFPDILLNKGQFFGEEGEEKPLRMYLGGQFYTQEHGAIMGRTTPLKVTKNTKEKWSFNKKHVFYQMASAAKLIDASKDDAFIPADIDKLLGQAFNFEAQIFMKENKGKEYYTEYIKFQGALTRGQKAPEGEVKTFMIQFNKENDLADLKELRSHVKNTIKLASNFTGSKLEAQLQELYDSYKSQSDNQEQDADDNQEEAPAPVVEKKKPVQKKTSPKSGFDDMDDDVPF